MTGPLPLLALAGFAIGAALGAIYFTLLRRAVRRHAEGGTAAGFVGLTVVRIGLAVAVFWAVAHAGALPLLLALGGFLAARTLIRRRAEAEQ